ncbi:MAG: GGDEF domain-containing protein [Alcanivoracaceae bacterium]
MNAERRQGRERRLPNGTDLHLPWHLSLPPALEQSFQTHLLALSKSLIRKAYPVVVVLLLGGTVVEILVDPPSALHSWRVRLIAILAASYAWWAAAPERPDGQIQPAVCLTALVISLSNNYLSNTLHHDLAYSYYLFNLLSILLMGTLFRITVRWALLTSVAIFSTMLVSMIFFSRLSSTETLILFFFVMAGGVLSLFGHYSFEKLQRQHFLAERVLAMHRSELHSANQVLEYQVSEDPLTGTVNRRGMDDRLGRLVQQQGKIGTKDGNLYALLFDIDFFKQYNDNYGHLAGDSCLRTVAMVVQSMIQSEGDFVARYGGEEFLVVLNGIRLNDALVFAERVRDRIEKQGIEHLASRCSNVVTISVGVAGWKAGISKPAELIHLTDEALYEAKRLGRNRVMMIDDNGTLKPV